MPTSEARILANRQNAALSTGPRTLEGKEQSRRNSLKHGMTGSGVVLTSQDASEIEQLAETLLIEMAPKSKLGAQLVRSIATYSVRMDRGGRQETAAIATRVRHAVEEFDNNRLETADRLFDALGEDPQANLRKLRQMPEGVDRLVIAWGELRTDLTCPDRPTWNETHFEKAVNLTGQRIDEALNSRLMALSRATSADFAALANHEGGDLGVEARQGWARTKLVERIDAEIARLQSHRETLDIASIELDRLEAPDRALFDPSKEATLARRYEADAQRNFFRALKEFRKVEAEAAERARSNPAPYPNYPSGPMPPLPTPEPLASSWEAPDPLPGESFEAYRERAIRLDGLAMQANGRPLTVGRVQ